MLRTAAAVGDRVAVTGCVGSSGGGLKLMLEDLPAPPESAAFLREAHRRPQPAVAAGQLLAQAGVTTAMDVSDGLADDLSKLCLASGVAARIYADRIPVHPHLRQAFPADHLDLALHGGEDYLLLFTAPESVMNHVLPSLPAPPEGAAILGEITAGPPGQVTLVAANGSETAIGRAGWDHFG